MVRIRLKRVGRKKRPFYRIVVMHKQNRRNGAAIQELGFYNPMEKQLRLDKACMDAWIAKGAQPSEAVALLYKKAADDGSLVQLPKKPRKEHMGEANQAQKKEAKAVEVDVDAIAPAEAPAADEPEAEATEAAAE
jgi:small subunit ribosomal protein S16